ncbi:ATPase involved in chromosome partitioning [Synechococcus sp. PCC 7502]|uniref:ParA family protein n=1 Tax=Synechococcus sp. PCC 7502 TaxID=1173263 RepID=UPI00029FDE78|nr:ParA family protein [Synechococcus sp. PCC 7502]AFY72236.1 ATPase involved in chromosome partitioning [Synechococcus sp. PCC 7502]
MQEVWQVSLKHQLIDIYVQNPSSEWAEINISTSGLLNLTIVSDRFKGLSFSQRRDNLQNVLNQFKISQGFISLYTVEEARSLNLSVPPITNENSINSWQDLALLAANPQNQRPSLESELRTPRTITFYSFKGGVGRTTALTHVAWILAMRGRKVVAVDLDLEAPGLSTAFRLDPSPEFGIVDYFYERSYQPDGVEPNVLITKIFGEVTIPDATGRLFIVPAGALTLDYISKVDDLRAATILDNGETLWTLFRREIQEQLKPDVILVDSRTGINEWGALSLLQAADEAIIFLFPNEQNRQGIDLLLKSLNSFGKLSINFVFSPVPDLSETGMKKVTEIWKLLSDVIEKEPNMEQVNETDYEIADPFIVPYLPPIALADHYPVTGLLDYYNRIANLIDEDNNQKRLGEILNTKDSDERWRIIESLNFPALNAADPKANLIDLFQKTANFEKFLDGSTCLIKGRKGTGKTALYSLLLNHEPKAKELANGRLDAVTFFSGHGTFDQSRPSRDEFQFIHRQLGETGTWEALWRAYLILRLFQSRQLNLARGNNIEKFNNLRNTLSNLPIGRWQSEHTQALIQLTNDDNFRLIVKDALDLFGEQKIQINQTIWILYDDLDEDFSEKNGVREQALTGLFQLIQACDARRLTSVRFKIFIREDIWNRLNFDNKSHFNGRDLLLKWTRVDFLRLALRQAMQSRAFKNLVDMTSPIENIDTATEENLNKALDLLWGVRRRTGTKAKYVHRWVYERLSDLSGATFPRSLSVLLQGAKEHELSYKGQASLKSPSDRLIRGTSLERGLEKASEERCDAIRQEYPDLERFFESLEGVPALPTKEELYVVWQQSYLDSYPDFDNFSGFLSDIGLAKWREKEIRYGFADIYVYGFKMIRKGGR